MLGVEQLGRFINEQATRSAFRLEARDFYAIDSEEAGRYLQGEAEPTWAQGGDWAKRLTEARTKGVRRYRVHVLESPLNDYLRYECEWGYVYTTSVGEQIYILDTADVPRPEGLDDEDFWLLDDRYLLRMHYDDEGNFLGAEELPESALDHYRRQRDLALERAVAFQDYWNAHPEYWRENGLGKSTNVDQKES
ncbi:MAG: DUF6879 family protein [Micromonosporaceae bacterium]